MSLGEGRNSGNRIDQPMNTDTTLKWKNWVGNQSFVPGQRAQPRSEEEILTIVSNAVANNEPIRVAGAGHSFAPLVETEGTLLNLDAMRGVIAVDRESLSFDAWAATRISELGAVLWQHDLALVNQGDIDSQTIMGAIATGTHGSGIKLPNFSAMLRGARVVDGRGIILDIPQLSEPDILHALQTSLGMLGVVTRVTIQATHAHSIEEEIKILPFDEVMERWDDFMSAYRHFSFDWIPTDRSAELYGLKDTPRDSCIVKLHRERPSDAPTVSGASRTDRSYRIYPSEFEPNFHEMEFFMPVASGPDIVRQQRKIMLSGRFDSRFPMQVRFVASDEAWLSPAFGRESVVISISGIPGTNYHDYLRTAEHLFAQQSGRPHWGKLHSMTRDRIENLYPKFNEFVALRRILDPKGLFLNAHLRALFS